MPNDLEAKSRVKINKLLEEAGWRFFDGDEGKANIHLESHIKFDDFGDDFEKIKGGFIDFLLLDDNKNPLVVLEAKREKKKATIKAEMTNGNGGRNDRLEVRNGC